MNKTYKWLIVSLQKERSLIMESPNHDYTKSIPFYLSINIKVFSKLLT